MRWLLAVFVMVILSSAAQAAGPAPDDFAQEMLRRFRATDPRMNLKIDPADPLALRKGTADSADEMTINLHRVFQYCQDASPADCETSKQELIDKIGIQPLPPKAGTLRVIVRDEAYVAYLRRTFAKGGQIIEPRRIGDDLYALLAFDSPDVISVATPAMLEDLKLAQEAAWPLALRQTKAILPALPDGKKLSEQAAAYEGKEYLGSLLADTAAWRGVSAEAGADMFVTVVSDQFVFVGLLPDGPKLDAFKQTVADDCRAQQRCISDKIYRFRDGLWQTAD